MVSAASQRGWSRPPGPQLAKVAGHSGWPQQMAKAANAGRCCWTGTRLGGSPSCHGRPSYLAGVVAGVLTERVALLREEEPSSQEL